jgi:hypothetical protein
MKKNILLFCTFLLFIAGCSNKSANLPTITNEILINLQTNIYNTSISNITNTFTAIIPINTIQPTQTFTITNTPSITLLPTNTHSPTKTPTLIPLTSFIPLTFVDGLRSSPNNYVGKLIKAFTGISNDDPVYTYWLAPADYSPRGVYVNFIIDPNADNTVGQLKGNEYVWIYGIIKKTTTDFPLISILHVETIPSLQLPKEDGVFRVNIDIAPGRWKSMSDATETQSCYWARISTDGSIIQNYFGYGGTSLYIYKSDFAVEFKDCSVMVYLNK